jgi:hypothetical protein
VHLHVLERIRSFRVSALSALGISYRLTSSYPQTSTSLVRRTSSLSMENALLATGPWSPLLLLSLIPHVQIHGIAHVEKY